MTFIKPHSHALTKAPKKLTVCPKTVLFIIKMGYGERIENWYILSTHSFSSKNATKKVNDKDVILRVPLPEQSESKIFIGVEILAGQRNSCRKNDGTNAGARSISRQSIKETLDEVGATFQGPQMKLKRN